MIGTYLLIWSDHEAWPIGSLTFVQTFSGQDPEMFQHKFYGVFSSVAAVSETFRRMDWVWNPIGAAPLLILSQGGALLLFVHSHGDHPAGNMIARHHMLLAGVGLGAAISNAMAVWASSMSSQMINKWEVAWAGCVIIMGLQLLVYTE